MSGSSKYLGTYRRTNLWTFGKKECGMSIWSQRVMIKNGSQVYSAKEHETHGTAKASKHGIATC